MAINLLPTAFYVFGKHIILLFRYIVFAVFFALAAKDATSTTEQNPYGLTSDQTIKAWVSVARFLLWGICICDKQDTAYASVALAGYIVLKLTPGMEGGLSGGEMRRRMDRGRVLGGSS